MPDGPTASKRLSLIRRLGGVQPGDQPYIVKLEEGHSTQAPPHAMVALSIEEVNLTMSKLIGEGLKDAGP